jgi:hypothetical protein
LHPRRNLHLGDSLFLHSGGSCSVINSLMTDVPFPP